MLDQLHQNLPQYFRRNHVADSILDSLDFFRRTMSPMYLDYFIKTTSPIYNFLMTILAMKPFRRTSIIRRVHRYFRCFISNLHVSGFSSCRII